MCLVTCYYNIQKYVYIFSGSVLVLTNWHKLLEILKFTNFSISKVIYVR
jgi:hypothetical protein